MISSDLIVVSDQWLEAQGTGRIVDSLKITLRQGNVLPVGADTELIDYAKEITGRNARLLEDFAEQSVLSWY